MTGDTLKGVEDNSDWTVPPDFVQVPSAVSGVEVYAPAPEELTAERRTFKCPRCGASTAYSATTATLSCAYCGYTETPEGPVVGRAAQEAEFRVDTLEREERGWGLERREIFCESCGADISLEPTDLATTCPFCASNRVVVREETHSDLLRPGFLIPFGVSRDSAERSLRRWMTKGWMHPRDLVRAAASAHLTGVYLPFWTFSAQLDTSWKAEVGRKRTRTTLSGERKTEIKWEWRSGRLDLRIDDMLTPGSNRISLLLLERLYPFDLSALSVYDPAYLAGWRAQAYDVGLRPAWDEARVWMREKAKEAVRQDINSRHVRNMGMTVDMKDERWRYVLLPVFLVAYRLRGRAYQVMINGQTGRIAGQKPVDWRRVGGALALLLLPGPLLILLAGFLAREAAGVLTMVGLGLVTLSLFLAVVLLRQALAADDA
jgi:ribosomal protein S27AE